MRESVAGPKAGDVLNLGPIGAIFHVRKTAADTGGRSLEMEWVLSPRSSGTPVHIHPSATESYEVLEGALDIYIDGKWKTLSVGERASVAPGVPHTFKNPGNSSTRVYNAHSPAMRFGEYFESIHRIVASGLVRPDRMTPKSVLYLSLLMTSFDAEIRSIRPPQQVMQILAGVARLLGYRIPSKR